MFSSIFNESILLLTLLSLLWPFSQGQSCTLFGAIGNSVEGGGVLIGKTRDRPESLEQVFVEVSPKGGFRYKGISTQGRTAVTSGINEKGLIVVSASASNLEREGRITTVGKILGKASSVDEAIEMVKKGEVHGPVHYLAGDLHKIVLLEVIDGRRNGILVKEDGILYHTNHFILAEMKALNPRIGRSSMARFNRIGSLLSGGPFTKDRFMTFAKDHFNRPGNDSICRHFEAEIRSSERTVSAAVFYLPQRSPAEVWVALGQPCESIFERH
ncbi:MAG: C45 family autoproteolytic acyltransferase/hydrolase [Thermodesulfobacteriota bacterium]